MPNKAKRIYNRVRGAKALAFLQIDDKIVGIAALKIPADSYRDKIGKSAGVLLRKNDYPYELGYVVVDAAMRGQKLSQKLVNALLPLADRKCMFATTSSIAMHRVLPRSGFLKAGREYENDKAEKLTLYVT